MLADALLFYALVEAARDFEESCAAVAEAMASDPAEDMPLEDYRAQFEAARAVRRKQEVA